MHDGIIFGKFPEEVVIQGLKVGFFEPNDLGWQPGAAGWVLLREMVNISDIPPSDNRISNMGDAPERFKELRETRKDRLRRQVVADDSLPAKDTGDIKKILYVEDNKPMALSVSFILKSHKFSVKHFEFGKKAIEAFHKCPMDWHAAIIDLGLPDITGMELITEINKNCPTLPIIVLSGASNIMERLYLYTSGASAVLAKPCHGQDLIDVLNGLITMPPAPLTS
jgi:CheY-like chemotaxis protein